MQSIFPYSLSYYILSYPSKWRAHGRSNPTQPQSPWQPILWSLLLKLNVTVVVKAFEKWPAWIALYKCRSSHHIPSCMFQRPRLYYITAHYAHRSPNSLRLIVRPLFALKQEEKKRERKGRHEEEGWSHHLKRPRKKKNTDGEGLPVIVVWLNIVGMFCCMKIDGQDNSKQKKTKKSHYL